MFKRRREAEAERDELRGVIRRAAQAIRFHDEQVLPRERLERDIRIKAMLVTDEETR